MKNKENWKIWETEEELLVAIERNSKLGNIALANNDNKVFDNCLERNQIMQQCLREWKENK